MPPNSNQLLKDAMAAHQAGELDHSESLYKELLGHLPDHSDANYLLGILKRQTGCLAESEELLRKALATEPDEPGFLFELATTLTALPNRLQEVSDLYLRAAELRPDHVDTSLSRGRVLFALGQCEEAIKTLSRVLELEPHIAEAHTYLGSAYYSVGKKTDAEKHLQQATALDNSLVTAHYNLGLFLKKETRCEEARTAYRMALQLDPNHAGALTVDESAPCMPHDAGTGSGCAVRNRRYSRRVDQ
jgi:tetratricopeptide (TPR) repeat protein